MREDVYAYIWKIIERNSIHRSLKISYLTKTAVWQMIYGLQ